MVNSFRVYGTSDVKIQNTLRKFKQAELFKQHIDFQLIVNDSETKQFKDSHMQMTDCIQVCAAIKSGEEAGSIEVLGYMSKSDLDYIKRQNKLISPIWRGGDFIFKITSNGRTATYEPLAVSNETLFHNPIEIVQKNHEIRKMLTDPKVEWICEQKNYGLAFHLEEAPTLKTVTLK